MKKIIHDTLLNVAHIFVQLANKVNDNYKVVAISEDADGGKSLIFGYALDKHRGSLRVIYSKKLTSGFKEYLLENIK